MTDETTNSETTQPIIQEPAAVDLRSMLPEDLRDEPSLANYKDVGDMAKSLVHAQKELGSRTRIPGPEASDEVKKEFYTKITQVPGIVKLPDPNDAKGLDEFYTKLGRPTSPEGYKIDLGEGVAIDENMATTFKQVAHKIGLTSTQAQALVELEAARNQQIIDGMHGQKAATKDFLVNHWGNEFENNLNLGKETLLNYSQKYPEAAAALMQGDAGNNPVFLLMAAELGRVYKESGVIQGNRDIKYGLTPDEARNRLTELKANKDHPYWNTKDPKHRQALDEVEQLHIAANPENRQTN